MSFNRMPTGHFVRCSNLKKFGVGNDKQRNQIKSRLQNRINWLSFIRWHIQFSHVYHATCYNDNGK